MGAQNSGPPPVEGRWGSYFFQDQLGHFVFDQKFQNKLQQCKARINSNKLKFKQTKNKFQQFAIQALHESPFFFYKEKYAQEDFFERERERDAQRDEFLFIKIDSGCGLGGDDANGRKEGKRCKRKQQRGPAGRWHGLGPPLLHIFLKKCIPKNK